MTTILRDMKPILCFSFVLGFLGKVNNLEIQKREIASCEDSVVIVDKHNDLRRNEGASNMKKVVGCDL